MDCLFTRLQKGSRVQAWLSLGVWIRAFLFVYKPRGSLLETYLVRETN